MEGLRPLGVGELLDASFRIYRERAKTLLLCVIVPVVPVIIFSALINLSAQADVTVDPATGQPNVDGGDLTLVVVGSLLGAFASFIATSLATAACFRSISGAYVGDDPDWRESLRFALNRLWSVLGMTVVLGLALLLGLLVCCVGALYPLTIFAVAMPVLLVEGLPVMASLGRARDLAAGFFWKVLGVQLLRIVLSTVFQSIVAAPIVAVALSKPSPTTSALVNGIASTISTVLVTPWAAALTMALYVDLRVRKEGFDLVLWAQRVGAAVPVGGFPGQPGAPQGGWPLPGPAGWVPPPQYPPPGQYPGHPPLQQPPPPPPPPPPSPGAQPPGPAPWPPPGDEPGSPPWPPRGDPPSEL